MARLPDETALGRAGSFRSGRAILRQPVVGTSGAGQIIAKAVEGFGATAGNVARDQLKQRDKAKQAEQAEAALQRVVAEREQQRDATDAIRATTEHIRGLNDLARDIGAEPDFTKHAQMFEREAKKLITRSGDSIGNEGLLTNFLGQAEERTDSFRTRVLANVVRAERDRARTDIDSALQTHFDLYTDVEADEPQRVQALAQLNDMIALAGARGIFSLQEVDEKRQRFLFGAVREDAALEVARDPRAFLAELEVKDGRFAVLPAGDRVVMARAAGAQAVATALDTDPATLEEVLKDPLVAKNLTREQRDKARDDALARAEAIKRSERTEAIRAFATATPALVARARGNETFTDINGTPQPAGPPLTIAEADAMIARLKQGDARAEALQLHEALHETLVARGGTKEQPLDAKVFAELMQSISNARITPGKPIDVEASVSALVDVQGRVLRAQRLGQITNVQADSILTRAIPAVMARIERDGMGGAGPESPVAELYEHGFALISDLVAGTDEATDPAVSQALFSAIADTIDASDGQALTNPEKKEQERQELDRALRQTFDGLVASQAFEAPIEFPDVGNMSSRDGIGELINRLGGAEQQDVPLPDRKPMPLPNRNPNREAGRSGRQRESDLNEQNPPPLPKENPRRPTGPGPSMKPLDEAIKASRVITKPLPPGLEKAMNEAGITHSIEQRMFLAQVWHESRLNPKKPESGKYTVERMRKVFGKKRFPLEKARKVAGNEEATLNRAYANVNGNGDEKSKDGWKYRGRGLIQLTGRENYEKIGDALGLDLVNNPDLALVPENSIKIAIEFWFRRVNRDAAIEGDVRGATRRINPGLLGLKERTTAFESLGGKAR